MQKEHEKSRLLFHIFQGVIILIVKPNLISENGPGQVLEVDLVHDSRPRRNNQQIGEGFRAPFEEVESLLVSLEFHRLVVG